MSGAYFLPIERSVFSDEHELFRKSVRRFMQEHVIPNLDAWNEQCHPGREVWLEAGKHAMLCVTVPEQYGGAGADRKFSTVLIEEQQRNHVVGLTCGVFRPAQSRMAMTMSFRAQKRLSPMGIMRT